MLYIKSPGGSVRWSVRIIACIAAILSVRGEVQLLPPQLDSHSNVVIRLQGLQPQQRALIERVSQLFLSDSGNVPFVHVATGDWGQSAMVLPASQFQQGYYRAIIEQNDVSRPSRLFVPTALQSVQVGDVLRLAPTAMFESPRPTNLAGAKLVIHPSSSASSIGLLRLVPLGGVEVRLDGSVYYQNQKVARVEEQGARLSVSFLSTATASAVEAVAHQVEFTPHAGVMTHQYDLIQWDWAGASGISASPQIQTVITQTRCGGPQDVVIALDRSFAVSATDFDEMIDAVRQFILGFPLAPGYQQLGIVSFCEESSIHVPLTGNRSELLAALSRIKRGARLEKVSCNQVYLGAGLNESRLILTNTRSERTIVLLSPGHEVATPQVIASWESGSRVVAGKAKSAGIRVVSVAVGNSPDLAHMKELASSPADALTGTDRSSLESVLQKSVTPHCIAADPLPAIDPGPARIVWLPEGLEVSGTCLHCGPDAEAGWRSSANSPGVSVSSRGYEASVHFSSPGEYELEWHVTDAGFHSVSNLHVTVLQSNLPPAVLATVEEISPSDRLLLGTVTDDGIGLDHRRSSSSPTTSWRQISGPGSVVFGHSERARTFAHFTTPGSYVLELEARDPGGLRATALVPVEIVGSSLGQESFHNVGYVSAGVGGLRDLGEGTIELTGIHGPVIKAVLLWHGPVDSENPAANAQALFQGHWVTGQSIGISHDDGWTYSRYHPYATGQAYRADVTPWVPGDGSFRLQRLVKTPQLNVNGASLLVVFEEPDPSHRRDVTWWTGNDSNGEWSPALNGAVSAVAVQSNGCPILVGPFTEAAGFTRIHMVRLLPQGEIDHEFNPGTGVQDEVLCVALDSVGRVLAGGRFVAGDRTNGLSRWNPDGTRDNLFSPTLPPATQVRCVVEKDQMIWAGASDGLWSVTSGGRATLRVPGVVNALMRTHSGVLWAAGEFRDRGRQARLIRVQSGAEPVVLTPNIEGEVLALAETSDDRVFVGGRFVSVDGQPRHGVARLLANGSLDPTWISESLNQQSDQNVRALKVQPENDDGTASGTLLIVGGQIHLSDGDQKATRTLVRLFDGVVDEPSFRSMRQQGDETVTSAVTADKEGNLWIAGRFESASTRNRILVDASGTPLEANRGDEGWSLPLPVVQSLEGAEIELHVSDGQSAHDRGFLDPSIFVNGQPWLQPETQTLCDEEQDQLFSGMTVPNENRGCAENLGLWDVMRRPVPHINSNPPRWTLTSRYEGPASEQDLVTLVGVVTLTSPSGPPAHKSPILALRDDEFSLSRRSGPARLDILGNDHLPVGVRVEQLIGMNSGRVEIAEDGTSLWFKGATERDQSDVWEFDYVVSTTDALSATGHVALRMADNLPPLLPQGRISQPGRLGTGGSPTRGLNRFGDVYRYEALEPQTLSLEVLTREFPGHLYLRDPHGDLMGADWHSSEGFGTHPPLNGNLSLNQALPTAGIYWIEVAGNSPGDQGDYELRLDHYAENGSPLAVWMDEVAVSDFMQLGGVDPRGRTVSVLLRNNSPDRTLSVGLSSLPETAGMEVTVSPTDWISLAPRSTRTLSFRVKAESVPPGTPLITGIDIHTAGFPTRTSRAEFIAVPDQPSLLLHAAQSGKERVEMSVQSLRGENLSGVVFIADSRDGQQTWPSDVAQRVWEPIPPGNYSLWVRADQGVSQRIQLTVKKGDAPGAARPDFYSLTMNAGPCVLSVLTNDLGGLKLLSVSAGSLGATEKLQDQAIRYIPNRNVTGTDQFSYVAVDETQHRFEAIVTIELTQPRVEWIEPEPESVFSLGRTIRLATRVDRSLGAVAMERIWDGGELISEKLSPPWTADWTPRTPGFHSLIAEVLDNTGIWRRSESVVVGLATESDRPPAAKIVSPEEREHVREGQLHVRGVAYDPDEPVSYAIILTGSDGNVLSQANGRSQQPGEQDLATLDLTRLQNGLFTVSLYVTGGVQVATHSVNFGLQSELKVGRLHFTTTDLRLPTDGVPLVIARTYDSLNPSGGDFGPGWSLAMYDMQVVMDEDRVEAEDADTGEGFLMRAGGGRNMALTLPSGERIVFDFALIPGAVGDGAPCFCYTAQWKSMPGVPVTLTATGNRELRFVPFQKELPPFWVDAGPETSYENYDFRGWVLTNSEGSVFRIERDYQGTHALESGTALPKQVTTYGPPRLKSIQARTGERIEIEQGARIDHVDAGNHRTMSLVLRRDKQGRITEIYDPRSMGEDGNPLLGALPSLRYEYDPRTGNLTAVKQLQDAKTGVYGVERYEYIIAQFPHYLTRVLDSRGVTVSRHEFDSAGRLSELVDAAGASTRYVHDLANHREEVSNAAGHRVVHEYDNLGNVTRSAQAGGAVTVRSFDEFGRSIAETNALGTEFERWTQRAFDEAGRIVAITNGVGVQQMGYGSAGQLLWQTNPSGIAITNGYDSAGHLSVSGWTAGTLRRQRTFTYDEAGRLHSMSEGSGATQVATYDAAGRVATISVLGSSNEVLSAIAYRYDRNGNRVAETRRRSAAEGDGSVVSNTYAYDAQNRHVATTNALGEVERSRYDLDGRLVARTDEMQRETVLIRDRRGLVIESVEPSDVVTPRTVIRTLYDAQGRELFSMQPTFLPEDQDPYHSTLTSAGSYTEYDEGGRVARTGRCTDLTLAMEPDGDGVPTLRLLSKPTLLSTNETHFDGLGRISWMRDVGGMIRAYGYDAYGQQTSVTHALGTPWETVTRSAFSPEGLLKTSTDELGNSTDFEYDAFQRRIRMVLPAVDGRHDSVATLYDESGRELMRTNELGVVTALGYDLLGYLVAVTNAFGTSDATVTRFGYDGNGQRIKQTDALGRETHYAYDPLGRRVGRRLPDGNWERVAYDPVGNVVWKTNFNGRVVHSEYDAKNRLLRKTEVRESGSSLLAAFRYTATGQRASQEDPSGKTAYTYDDFDRVRSKDKAGWGRFDYDYSTDGHVISMSTTAAGETWETRYEYDPLGRLAGAQLPAFTLGAHYSFDSVGRIRSAGFQNGVTNQYLYDSRGRIRELIWGHGDESYAQFNYQRDATGQAMQLVEKFGPGRSDSSHSYDWNYDALHRLRRETLADGAEVRYRYDPVGNRLEQTSGSSFVQSRSWRYDTNDRVDPDSNPANFNPDFDASGNALRGNQSGRAYEDIYDAEGRLAERRTK